MYFGGVFQFFFVEVEDEDFVALLEEVSGEAAADALGRLKEGLAMSFTVDSAVLPPEMKMFFCGGALADGLLSVMLVMIQIFTIHALEELTWEFER